MIKSLIVFIVPFTLIISCADLTDDFLSPNTTTKTDNLTAADEELQQTMDEENFVADNSDEILDEDQKEANTDETISTRKTKLTAFKWGKWTWLGGFPVDIRGPYINAVATANYSNGLLYSSYRITNKRWWSPPYDKYCYGLHAIAYRSTNGKWYAGYVDFFGMDLARVREFRAPWKKDTPFVSHPPAKGTPAYWWVYQVGGKHIHTKPVRIKGQFFAN